LHRVYADCWTLQLSRSLQLERFENRIFEDAFCAAIADLQLSASRSSLASGEHVDIGITCLASYADRLFIMLHLAYFLQAASGATLESIGGYGVETGNKPFDPLKIADWIPADRLRASELANGRYVYTIYTFRLPS
jgi:hypothetical protein